MAQKDVDFILSDVLPALRAAGLVTHIEAIKAVLREGAAPPDAAFLPEDEGEPVPEPVAEPEPEDEPEPIVKDRKRRR